MRVNVYYIISGIFCFLSLITGIALICSPDIILGIICGMLFLLSTGFCRWAIDEDAIRARRQRGEEERIALEERNARSNEIMNELMVLVKKRFIEVKVVKKNTIQDRLDAI